MLPRTPYTQSLSLIFLAVFVLLFATALDRSNAQASRPSRDPGTFAQLIESAEHVQVSSTAEYCFANYSPISGNWKVYNLHGHGQIKIWYEGSLEGQAVLAFLECKGPATNP